MDNTLGSLSLIEEQNIITFFNTSQDNQEIFSLTMRDGKLIGSTTQPEVIDEAARLFFENLRIHGQSLLDKIVALESLAKETPNDMEFGAKARKFLDKNRTNN
jgi:hypothetical protein